MSTDRWERTKDLFESALQLERADRDKFLRTECLGDEDLLSEVHALLAQDDLAGDFLKTPLLGSLAGQAFPYKRQEVIGGFRIVNMIGSGGMGRVYEAFDIAENRPVALKVLNASFSLNSDDISRFEREAWIGGRLNHANIVKAYRQGTDSGLSYISMELMEGPSLATEILITKAESNQNDDSAVRADRVRKMILLFAEVAGAVHYVHQCGIIHRDIKPQNLLLTAGGSRLLLSDFGLARDEAMSHLTRQGDFFGTVRYMSPEQLFSRKNQLTFHTDIWSLGVSLYEAVTLDLPYNADTEEGYLSAVSLHQPLPARSRNHRIARDLETILMKCLEKNPLDRYKSAADLQHDLLLLASGKRVTVRRPSLWSRISRFSKQNRKPIWSALAAGVCIAGLALFTYFFVPASVSPKLVMKPFTAFPGGEYEPKFSPDEKKVAFIWNHGNDKVFNLYVQNIDRNGLRRVTSGSPDEASPCWSPDGSAIAFVRNASLQNSGVFIQRLAGGPEKRVTTLAPLEHSFERRLDWSPDGRYLALSDAPAPGQPLAIFLVSPIDGSRTRLTTPIPGTQGDLTPAFSPDGKTLTFLRFGGSDIDDVYSVPLSGGTPRRLTFDNSFISDYAWMANGRELAVNSKRSGSNDLWVAPLNGSPIRPANGPASGAYFIAVSPKKQSLALSMWAADTNIWRVDLVPGHPEKAAFQEIIDSTMDDRSAQYSPDNSRIVFRSNQSGTDELWLASGEGKDQSQLTFFNGPLTGSPRWSSDGNWIAFDSRPTGHADIFVISQKGGEPRRITTGSGDNVVPNWSLDGKYIYFSSNRRGDWQIWKVPIEGESSARPAIQITNTGGFSAAESFDSQWIYYAKGREVPGLWKISTNGGQESEVTPALQTGFAGYWALGRNAVFFISCDANKNCAINAQSLLGGPSTIVARLPKEPPFQDSGISVSRDGKSFLYPQVDHAESTILLGTNFH